MDWDGSTERWRWKRRCLEIISRMMISPSSVPNHRDRHTPHMAVILDWHTGNDCMGGGGEESEDMKVNMPLKSSSPWEISHSNVRTGIYVESASSQPTGLPTGVSG